MAKLHFLLFLANATCVALASPEHPVATTECELGAEFLLFLESLNFDSAKQACADNLATLARISNEREHNQTVKLLLEFGNQMNNFWFGIKIIIITFKTHCSIH